MNNIKDGYEYVYNCIKDTGYQEPAAVVIEIGIRIDNSEPYTNIFTIMDYDFMNYTYVFYDDWWEGQDDIIVLDWHYIDKAYSDGVNDGYETALSNIKNYINELIFKNNVDKDKERR